MYGSYPCSAELTGVRYPNTFPKLNRRSQHDLGTFENMDLFSFLIMPESFDGHEFIESLIEWMDTCGMEM